MAKFVMKNLTVTVAGANLSDHVSELSLEVREPEIDTTAFGTSVRTYISGIREATLTMTLHSDFAASSTNATITPLLGSYATVVASGTLGGTTTAGTAVCYVNAVQPIGGQIGDLSVQTLSWPVSGSVTGFGLV